MDCAVDTAATQQGRVRRINYGFHRLLRNIPFYDFDLPHTHDLPSTGI
jgi:hypothetical protein